APVAGAAVSLRGAGLRFGDRWVWRGVDLIVAPGEFLVLLGPNGAGKTTLLRVLLGLERLTEGSVALGDQDPRRGRRLVGYVPQRRTLDRDLGVRARDLVGLGVDGDRWGIEVRPQARRERRRLVDEALEAVGASDYAERPVGQLSGGEQQRLLLAQALVTRPRILLLDEPLSSLDLRSQGVASALVASVARERGITVVLVAHDVNPLVSVLDRVAYIAAGRVTAGRPEAVLTSRRLSELYEYPVEVLRDSRGRYVVVGLDDDESHHA
ncbi:MAG TPA: metal ABC transporter ATP-binding protein, partial [Candidatus Dormibacteraeota bacterium]|nr:metal ABC transporter ATP-binding protein [Candidatus Dormibacteraeota bacterium]